MSKKPLREFFEKYIEGTAEKAVVADDRLCLCSLTNIVASQLGLDKEKTYKVQITTRALKHLFDKKPAEEFHCILDCMDEIARYPSHIYKNKPSKRGEYCFLGSYNGSAYVCSIEIYSIMETQPIDIANLEEDDIEIQIATSFRNRDEKYLNKCTLLWSREGGNPHRSALDAPEESTNAPQ